MASSLERLAANVPTDAFWYTSQVFQNEKLVPMKQKGVYPYDYMDSFGKFGVQQLPPSTKFNKPLQMTDKDEQQFKAAEECHICGKKYLDTEVRVRDHCYITGQYRGSAHQDDNLKLKLDPDKFKVPVIFHNLRGYDSHFIMQEIGSIEKSNNLSINCIPNNMESIWPSCWVNT